MKTELSIVLIVLYVDALLFVASTMIMSKSFNVNLDMNICDGAIVLCEFLQPTLLYHAGLT